MVRQREERVRSDKLLAFVRLMPCSVLGCDGRAEAAHIRMGAPHRGKRPTGMGEKPDDRWTLPLCRLHHIEQHSGNELEFWTRQGIDPFAMAEALAECATHGDVDSGFLVIRGRQYLGAIERPGYVPW